ncbi:MAG: cupin domain-containing protein [Burkholderiaceae bacterium]|nr:cupin domain-containing protein [Burkholderiaceae bacterium]
MLQLGTSTIGEQAFHEGEEMFYVLHGAVEITLGTRSVRLGEGDFAEFPGMVRHQLRGLETGTRVLVVITERGLT